MRLFGFDLTLKALPRRTVAAPALRPLYPAIGGGSGSGGGWSSLTIREPYTGAWQQNQELRADSVLAYFAVFACVTLIASDIAKLRLRLVEQDDDGIWHEVQNPAYSPVLRTPNRYQTIIKFVERWMISKLVAGNTYVLKQRDNRRVVVAMYVLDPARVTPLIAPDGSVYYQLGRDDLSDVPELDPRTNQAIVVPASEIIHDMMCPIFHPLCGVTPLFACGLSASQGLTIQNSSSRFFANGSKPGGILTAPGKISDEAALRLKGYWEENFGGANYGRVAILGDGLKYEGMAVNAVDSQLIDQLKWTADTVCSCYHVPAYMIGVGPPPPYANVEPLLQQYYSQCIQSLLGSFEACLDRGLEFPRPTIGTEFDIDDLLWMDTATRTKAGTDAISGAMMSPNEARRKYFGLGKVAGGDSPLAQQQYYSLAALAKRDASDPFANPVKAVAPEDVDEDEDDDDEFEDVEDDDEDDDEGGEKALPLHLLTAAFESHLRRAIGRATV
jgi:HK97 family phage portal protein